VSEAVSGALFGVQLDSTAWKGLEIARAMVLVGKETDIKHVILGVFFSITEGS